MKDGSKESIHVCWGDTIVKGELLGGDHLGYIVFTSSEVSDGRFRQGDIISDGSDLEDLPSVERSRCIADQLRGQCVDHRLCYHRCLEHIAQPEKLLVKLDLDIKLSTGGDVHEIDEVSDRVCVIFEVYRSLAELLMAGNRDQVLYELAIRVSGTPDAGRYTHLCLAMYHASALKITLIFETRMI